MTTYSLSSEPNFRIAVAPEEQVFWMHFRYLRGLMYVTIEDDNGRRIAGPVRVCNNQWLIPHKAYNPLGSGNFVVVDSQGQYPFFGRFSKFCELQYFSLQEIESGVTN